MTTMRDVARVAGVSAKTVSRVFNDDPHVTQETRDRVRWAMERLNYVPNMLARSFRAGADTAVGVAFPDIADPFFAAMTSSIEEELVRRDMAMVVTSLGYDPDRERGALEMLLRRQISGLIVASISRDQSYLTAWHQRTPMVFVDRKPRGMPTVSTVSVVEDDLRGAREAVTHLVRHGHQRIALAGVSTYVSTTHRRIEGYHDGIQKNALADEPGLVCLGSDSATDVASEFVKLLSLPKPPTAVFSVSIPCTMALVHALQQAGRTDIALVGFGDFPMADALSPAVSVVDQDPAQLGRVAVDRLSQLIQNPGAKVRRKTILPVRLIPRGSGELPPSPES